MQLKRLVIVGASLAGARAAQAARAAGFDGELVLIGAEPRRPYTRPPLSKQLMQGKQRVERVMLPLAKLEATWRLGVGAVALDRAHHRVALADGTQVPYDRLIVATGAHARRWHGPGAELDGVHTLRTLDDALALKAELAPGRRLAIVGAGFIGCEIAASARALGVAVTLLDVAQQPMTPFGADLGARFAQLHREHGVEVLLGTPVEALRGAGRFEAVELADGSRVEADLVLIALGARLNSRWLEGSGVELDPALVCDATLTSSVDPDILAAGDVASVPVPLAGGRVMHIEHWTTAAEHGQLAGTNALLEHEQRVPHTSPPYFWSDQYEYTVAALGCPMLAVHTEPLEQAPDREQSVAGCVDQAGRLIGVITLNAAKRLSWYRRRFAGGVPPALGEIRAQLAAETATLGPPPGAVARRHTS